MAAAEARAVWQRAANRCFVQEDAKRAPKLSPPPPPCSSTSSSSASSAPHTSTSTDTNCNSQSHSHSHPDDEEHHQQLIPDLTPLNFNWNSNPYPMSGANLPADTRWWLQLHPTFAYQREFLVYEPKSKSTIAPASTTDPISPSPDSDKPNSPVFMSFVKHGGSTENNVEDRKLRYDVKPCEDPLLPKKSEPWWRVADGEELAWMVAQKAAQHVENCDLPRPTQTKVCYSDPTLKVGMAAFGDINLLDFDSSASAYWDEGNLPLRNDCLNRCRERKKGSREELLEALCHSQTRAREAEMAAKKAQGEKEDIVRLLFRQASHLFACRQWLKMLQLENLCLQLRICTHHHHFPNSKQPEPEEPPPNKTRGNSICRYVVVFALAGAGLLFGWTLGWLLPKL